MTELLPSEVVEALRSMTVVDLGRRVRTERLRVGLTQTDLATPAKITAAYVSRIEDGQRRPSVAVLGSFAATMGIDPAKLVSSWPSRSESELREVIEDLWSCIGASEIAHLQGKTLDIVRENHVNLWHAATVDGP